MSMTKAIVITHNQASALESLHYNKCMSAGDFDRAALEQLVSKKMATKGNNGHAVTYTITPLGEAVWKGL